MSAHRLCKRLFDICFSLIALIITFIPVSIILLIVKLTSKGPAIHWSERIGVNNRIFLMPKIRSMSVEAPQLATDLLSSSSEKYVTPIGKVIRKTSLDEFPQFWSILIGDMSFVGPRPALFNQHKLIALRTEKNIHKLQPGLTGWAQINGRDNLTDEEKTMLDEHYLKNQSFFFDLKIIFLTFIYVSKLTNVSH